ncbi:hypothetical protein Lal_00032722 [Lupinus albus]|nr:hypothetical protein Lal_00032722 [Lupinus albus]
MIDMTKFTVVRYGDGTNGRDNLGALSFYLDSPLAERTENHQALATGTSYNPHTSEHSEWLTKWNKAKKDNTDAPTKDPTRGKVAEAPLLGAGAGAGTSVAATTAVIEAAAMTTAQKTFFISMMMMSLS